MSGTDGGYIRYHILYIIYDALLAPIVLHGPYWGAYLRPLAWVLLGVQDQWHSLRWAGERSRQREQIRHMAGVRPPPTNSGCQLERKLCWGPIIIAICTVSGWGPNLMRGRAQVMLPLFRVFQKERFARDGSKSGPLGPLTRKAHPTDRGGLHEPFRICSN